MSVNEAFVRLIALLLARVSVTVDVSLARISDGLKDLVMVGSAITVMLLDVPLIEPLPVSVAVMV